MLIINTIKIVNNFDDVFHKKIASQDSGEVILFTKKSRTRLNPEASTELANDFDNTDSYKLEDESERLDIKSDAMTIEFNAQNNKIELVPVEAVEKNKFTNSTIKTVKAEIDAGNQVKSEIVEIKLEDLAIQRQLLEEVNAKKNRNTEEKDEAVFIEQKIETNEDPKVLFNPSSEDLAIQSQILAEINCQKNLNDTRKDETICIEQKIESQLANEIKTVKETNALQIDIMDVDEESSDSDDGKIFICFDKNFEI